MQDWEEALNKFLKNWINRKEVIGVLVCGSFIIGNPSKHSDIDTHIILSENVNWRERGNKIINGYLIEYFANPARQIREYFKEDYKDNDTMAATQFATGKILLDKNGTVKELKKEANQWLKKKFEKKNKIWIELSKYSLWDALDNLEDKQKSKSFTYAYYNYLRELINKYNEFLGIQEYKAYKTYELLTSEETRKKYLMKEHPDKIFQKLFIKAMSKTDINYYRKLTEHVLKRMGGFKIDGCKIKSPTTKRNKTGKEVNKNASKRIDEINR